jgi:hypothetical protein
MPMCPTNVAGAGLNTHDKDMNVGIEGIEGLGSDRNTSNIGNT